MRPGTVEWQSPDMVPLFEDADLLVAYVHPERGRVVAQGSFFGGDFCNPETGLYFERVFA